MDIDELRELFGLSRHTIHAYVKRGLIPPPTPRRSRWARYGPEHVAAIRAYQALKHNNTILSEVGPLLREEGITLVEFVRRRESAIKAHGLGVA